jgi:hypothetical protein
MIQFIAALSANLIGNAELIKCPYEVNYKHLHDD